MSFQMVLLLNAKYTANPLCFGTMSFQMVLLLVDGGQHLRQVLELCHSRWFYYHKSLLTSKHVFWNYVIPDGSTTRSFCERGLIRFWNYVIPDGSTTTSVRLQSLIPFWNYVIPDGSTTLLYTNCDPV